MNATKKNLYRTSSNTYSKGHIAVNVDVDLVITEQIEHYQKNRRRKNCDVE